MLFLLILSSALQLSSFKQRVTCQAEEEKLLYIGFSAKVFSEKWVLAESCHKNLIFSRFLLRRELTVMSFFIQHVGSFPAFSIA